MQARRLALDKSDHIACAQARQLDCSIAETIFEEARICGMQLRMVALPGRALHANSARILVRIAQLGSARDAAVFFAEVTPTRFKNSIRYSTRPCRASESPPVELDIANTGLRA